MSDDRALKRLDEQLSRSGQAAEYQASVATTQAVDIIRGGVKVNALPESAYAVMNHRIMERRCGAFLLKNLLTSYTYLL